MCGAGRESAFTGGVRVVCGMRRIEMMSCGWGWGRGRGVGRVDNTWSKVGGMEWGVSNKGGEVGGLRARGWVDGYGRGKGGGAGGEVGGGA